MTRVLKRHRVSYKIILVVTQKLATFLVCDQREASKAYLQRFAAAGAAIRYQVLNEDKLGYILALDIALRRNDADWVEQLPEEIDSQIDQKLYYGHFFCHVFHQDYVLKKGADAKAVKAKMLALLDSRGAKYPAEHNVGHLYEAADGLKAFYRQLDPTNRLQPWYWQHRKTQTQLLVLLVFKSCGN